jgi:F-type H+-transporting ATPase subunit a
MSKREKEMLFSMPRMPRLGRKPRILSLLVVASALCTLSLAAPSVAQHGKVGSAPVTSQGQGVAAQPNTGGAEHPGHEAAAGGHSEQVGAAVEHGGDGKGHEKSANAFKPHAGSWFNPIARSIFGQDPPQAVKDDPKHTPYKPGEKRGNEVHYTNVDYDYIVIAFVLMALLALLGLTAARRASIRPSGKPHSLANSMEAAVEGVQKYLVGVMGESLAQKYTPLIASFFFTILLFNWSGLIPGFIAPTSNPNVPFALALCAFFMVHIIAIKETSFKAWFMHFVGEPAWMAPLMFPLHIIGELVKPVSLSLRLLGNVFGEEVVIAKLIGLALLAGASFGLPTFIPFQLPILFLGILFGFLQALVFSTLLAIYIAILSTHHDAHDEHNVHGHVDHTDAAGRHQITAHPTESPVA